MVITPDKGTSELGCTYIHHSDNPERKTRLKCLSDGLVRFFNSGSPVDHIKGREDCCFWAPQDAKLCGNNRQHTHQNGDKNVPSAWVPRSFTCLVTSWDVVRWEVSPQNWKVFLGTSYLIPSRDWNSFSTNCVLNMHRLFYCRDQIYCQKSSKLRQDWSPNCNWDQMFHTPQ